MNNKYTVIGYDGNNDFLIHVESINVEEACQDALDKLMTDQPDRPEADFSYVFEGHLKNLFQ